MFFNAPPLTIITVIGVGVIPSLIWLWFWLKEDKENPEPKPLIIKIFILGAMMVIPAYFIEDYINKSLSLSEVITNPNSLPLAIFISFAPLVAIEETLKWLAAQTIGISTKNYDEPIDAIIYLITAALGFAAAENILYLFSSLTNANTILSTSVLLPHSMRFLGANITHIVSSGLLGALIGRAFYARPAHRHLHLLIGLLLAITLHTTFNLFIMTYEGNILRMFSIFWGAAIVLIYLFERVRSTNYPA